MDRGHMKSGDLNADSYSPNKFYILENIEGSDLV